MKIIIVLVGTENNDFIAVDSAPLTIPSSVANGDTVTFTVTQIIGDLVREDNELFFVNFALTSTADSFNGVPRAQIIISDDGDGEIRTAWTMYTEWCIHVHVYYYV